MDLGIKGKNALVLASSRGLGLGIAKKLCEEGANVMISGRSAEKLAAASEALTSAGHGTCHYTVVDFFNNQLLNQNTFLIKVYENTGKTQLNNYQNKLPFWLVARYTS